ncbi:MAG: Spore coat protein [Thermocaproicibacter melissae]|jgi:spore coat protein CotF|uniref:spore coat protein n=1 Tax=Thermocaproicibacter melissae TaxID=2966552 RepID=UPI0024B15D3E|nr:spore coat protein [Thermocaproicibacter melissae]WBY63416.1 spore coat protein [Thermocaproicibacter melissae]
MNFSQVSGNQPSSNLQERDLMNDVLSSQKFITDTYNTFTNECATPNVRDGFMSILNEEHQIQAEVFDMMKQRGWYQTPAADQQKVNQAKQQYASQKAQS